MQLSEVKKSTGLSRKAIDLYEERGLICPKRVSVGSMRAYREYTDEDVMRLRIIAKLRELDLPLSDVQKVLNGENSDAVIQAHLLRQREKADELRLLLEKTDEVLHRLPPNSSFGDMSDILEDVISTDLSERLRYKLDGDFSSKYTRRITMLMFETFLDKPLNSKERWDIWYELLDQMEECVTPRMAENYNEVYGRLGMDQLCKDITLRRGLVYAYPRYGSEEENAKAEEIFFELERLTEDEDLFAQWEEYYIKIALGSKVTDEVSAMVSSLSDIYDIYNQKFAHMLSVYLEPLLQSEKGVQLKETISAQMEQDMFNNYGLIYFDFYNNTYRKIAYEQ